MLLILLHWQSGISYICLVFIFFRNFFAICLRNECDEWQLLCRIDYSPDVSGVLHWLHELWMLMKSSRPYIELLRCLRTFEGEIFSLALLLLFAFELYSSWLCNNYASRVLRRKINIIHILIGRGRMNVRSCEKRLILQSANSN